MITIPMGKRNRTFVDLQQLHEPPTTRIFKLPAAAAIGLTASVLRKLRVSGHFEVTCLIRRKGYREHDIKQFIDRLLALNSNPMNTILPRDCITLYQAMCRYHGTGEGSASIIRALLCGELRVLGNVDGTVRGLFVSRAEFQQLGKNERARLSGNGRTSSEVAKELCCAKHFVFALVGLRVLDARKTPSGLRISDVSIARFKKKYVRLAAIAREIGSSTVALMRHCAVKHIPMVVMKRRQAFIHIEDRDAVLSFRPLSVKRRFLGPSLFPDLELVEQLPKTSRPAA